MTIPASIFRAYDIRGVVDEELSEEVVFLTGKALGSMVLEHGESSMAVARDGRLSGPRLVRQLINGITSSGCDVVDLGMVSTPLLYYATNVLECKSGVMLTGSHNPANYNGLKSVVGGKTLTEEAIQALYQRIVNNQLLDGEGHCSELDIRERYVSHVTRDIKLAKPLKIVIDAGNGVAGAMAPGLFRAMNCNVTELYCDVDGTFPNHHPDPSQPDNLQDLIAAVKNENADIGLAFDGDGDRLGVVTSNGEIIWPDRLLMYYSKALLQETPNAKIIFDVKCTHHLAGLIEEHGGNPLMWKTGHSLIKAKMKELNAHLAGEMSGHFFFNDRWYGFDDGLYAAARLLEALSKEEKNSAEIFSEIPNSVNTPELKMNVSDEKKFSLMESLVSNASFESAKDILTIDGLRVNFADGWGLVRPSNTTPCLVMRFESNSDAGLESIKKLFRDWMLSVEPDLALPF